MVTPTPSTPGAGVSFDYSAAAVLSFDGDAIVAGTGTITIRAKQRGSANGRLQFVAPPDDAAGVYRQAN